MVDERQFLKRLREVPASQEIVKHTRIVKPQGCYYTSVWIKITDHFVGFRDGQIFSPMYKSTLDAALLSQSLF